MQNVVLVIHLLLALGLIGIVLLQRSEGGGLGIGGGGGGGAMTGRAAATALGKLTWGLAIAFICTSLALTVLETSNSASGSIVDGEAPAGTDAQLPSGEDLLPSLDTGPLVPTVDQ